MSTSKPPSPTLAGRLQVAWLARGPASQALLPLAWLYGGAVSARRGLYRRGMLPTHRLPVPVVVVGNLVAGGAGKTPATLAVVEILRSLGRTPGIVSRGYGRTSSDPVDVDPDTSADRAGDEPLLLRRRSGAPVLVAADRVGAAHALLQAHPEVDVVVADDGLQHLALGRDVEIVVFDERGIGNGRLLPAGPLREPLEGGAARGGPGTAAPRRLVLYNAAAASTPLPGWTSTRALAGVVGLDDWRRGTAPTLAALEALRGRRIVAVAGIAVPGRFFDLLRRHGLDIEARPLADHHDYGELPWTSTAGDVILTEKDAVKIGPGRTTAARVWVAPLDFSPEPAFAAALAAALGLAPAHAAGSPGEPPSASGVEPLDGAPDGPAAEPIADAHDTADDHGNPTA